MPRRTATARRRAEDEARVGVGPPPQKLRGIVHQHIPDGMRPITGGPVAQSCVSEARTGGSRDREDECGEPLSPAAEKPQPPPDRGPYSTAPFRPPSPSPSYRGLTDPNRPTQKGTP
jgi:hypothetical protein